MSSNSTKDEISHSYGSYNCDANKEIRDLNVELSPLLAEIDNGAGDGKVATGNQVKLFPPQPNLLSAPLTSGGESKDSGSMDRVAQLRSQASTGSASRTYQGGSATGNPRNKVALQPGHSLMDWIRLGQSGKDLTGVGGKIKDVSTDELAKHNKVNDAWIAIKGKVYNVTYYMDFHPGGREELMRGVGTDATELFSQVHAWVNYESILQKCVVGRLRSSVTSRSFYQGLGFLNCGKQKKKSDMSPSSENATKDTDSTSSVNNGPVPPRLDWFQKLRSISLIFYAKRKERTVVQVRVLMQNGRDISVHINFGEYVYVAHLFLEDEVRWPCSIKVSGESNNVEVVLLKKEEKLWKQFGKPQDDHGAIKNPSECKPSFRTFTVFKVLEVTHDTRLFLLQYKDQVLNHIPVGYHVQVKAVVEGNEIVRSYTPVPLTLHKKSLPQDVDPQQCTGMLCLMVKVYADGTLTPVLNKLQPSDSVQISDPLGSFNVNVMKDFKQIYFLAAGTGFTPMAQLILYALDNQKMQWAVSLMFFNKTEQDILWRDQLDALAEENSRFSVHHVLSSPGSDWQGLQGRIRRSLLEEWLPKREPSAPEPSAFMCICGPTAFTQVTEKLLLEIGYSQKNYHCFLG